MINLKLKKHENLPQDIVKVYLQQYNPENYLLVDLTSNYETKQYFQEKIMDIINKPWHLEENNAETSPCDRMLGKMPIPKPHQLNITEAQMFIFDSVIENKKYEFTDPFGTSFAVVNLQDFPINDIPPIFVSHGPLDNHIQAYRYGFYTGYIDATENINNGHLQPSVIFESVMQAELNTEFTNPEIYEFWRDLGRRHGQHYCMWQYIFSNHHKFLPFFIPSSGNDTPVDENSQMVRTKELIETQFDSMGTKDTYGWRYAFYKKTDYELLVGLLVKYFTSGQNELPEIKIKLRPRTKTSVAKTLHSIFKELGEELKTDTGFLNIVNILEPFSTMSDAALYKTLTR